MRYSDRHLVKIPFDDQTSLDHFKTIQPNIQIPTVSKKCGILEFFYLCTTLAIILNCTEENTEQSIHIFRPISDGPLLRCEPLHICGGGRGRGYGSPIAYVLVGNLTQILSLQ